MHIFKVFALLFIVLLSGCSKEKRADKKGVIMQEFIVELSQYARTIDSHFIIIPQNGSELAFNKIYPDEGLNLSFLAAIDGFGIEQVIYDGEYHPDDERLDNLNKIVESKTILVSDYVYNTDYIADAQLKATEKGFLSFPRTPDNYDYLTIPSEISNENAIDVNSLADAQNYLYLISNENYLDKESFIAAINATNYDLVLIDAFFNGQLFTKEEIDALKTKNNGAKRLVIAYMNVGAAESYRYYWEEDWKLNHPRWLKKNYEGYPDEIWVKFWHKDWKNIIYGNDQSYTKKLLNSGFDGAYLDNVEAFYFLYFD